MIMSIDTKSGSTAEVVDNNGKKTDQQHRPVRKVHNRGIHKVIGRFPSRKSNGSILWESQLERDCLHHLEMDSAVSSIRAQPFRIEYILNGKRRKYTPDFLADGAQRRDVIEVKPFEKTTSPEFATWKAAISAVLKKHDYRFVVMTEQDFRQEPRLANYKWLFRFVETKSSRYDLLRLLEAIRAGASTVDAAQLQCRVMAIDPDSVWHLIAAGMLEVDFDKPLNSQSIIKIRSARNVV
jgi:hypothetical protein